jgi:hypothetical protein
MLSDYAAAIDEARRACARYEALSETTKTVVGEAAARRAASARERALSQKLRERRRHPAEPSATR